MSKIISLTSENVKRLQAVQITPKGNVVVIGGKNGAGKSSVLDSIQYALGGDTRDKMPVRRGEEKAKIVVDLGDLIVKRTFTASGGTSLVVTNADGVKQMTPQSILDKLVGRLTFDPLEFSRQKPAQQSETLRSLVGLDFTDHDQKALALYDQRTSVNRVVKSLGIRLTDSQSHPNMPAEEISTATVLEEQERAQATNRENERLRARVVYSRDSLQAASVKLESLVEQQKKLQREIEAQQEALKVLQKSAGDDQSAAAGLKDVDVSRFNEQIRALELTNVRVRENRERAEVVADFKAKSAEADKLTGQIEAMDAAKRKKLTTAKYPIEGLLFDTAGGVTLSGIPFEQCSSAEQLRVSVAIGLALNPTLKVLLIRDGSLLDDDSMGILLEMAKQSDAQVWIERVGVDSTTSVIIEDGTVAAAEAEEPAPDTAQPKELL